MTDILVPAGACIVGAILGAFFYGGLLWTVAQGVPSQYAAIWFFVSFLVRMGIVAAGFCFVTQGHWIRAVLCLLGFVAARILVTRLSGSKSEACHAP
jgi:F1F0 ATPase subunit 2